MKTLLIAASALVLAGAFTASAQPGAPGPAASADTECAIFIAHTRYGARFDVRARSRAPASGEYEFILTKNDADGVADIVQGGAFDLSAEDDILLGSSELSLERGSRYHARLRLWDAHGDLCRAERRSR